MVKYSECFNIIDEALKEVKNYKVLEKTKVDELEILVFSIKNTHGEIHYRDDGFVCLSLAPYDEKAYHTIRDMMSDLFGIYPCISYDEKTDKDTLKCFEWVGYDEDAHVLNFLSCKDKNFLASTSNVSILTEKSDAYYKDRLKKKPGVYTGSLTEEEVEFYKNCSEYNLYYAITSLAIKLRTMQDNQNDLDLSDFTLEEEEIRFALEYLFVQTARFGTNVKPSSNYDAVILDMDYAMWLNSWNQYTFNCLEESDVEFLESMASKLEDVKPYLTTFDSNMYADGLKHIYIDRRYIH